MLLLSSGISEYLSERCSFVWHCLIGYGDRIGWDTWTFLLPCFLNDGSTGSVSPVKQTKSSSVNWANSRVHYYVSRDFMSTRVSTFCVDSRKHSWYSPGLYAYSTLKSVVTIAPTEPNSRASSWRNIVRCSTTDLFHGLTHSPYF